MDVKEVKLPVSLRTGIARNQSTADGKKTDWKIENLIYRGKN